MSRQPRTFVDVAEHYEGFLILGEQYGPNLAHKPAGSGLKAQGSLLLRL